MWITHVCACADMQSFVNIRCRNISGIVYELRGQPLYI